ncbi:MAG TPA: arginine--tRNA ligase, partial [Mycobacteriales bacterium]|nr:arginine--tRNA ligase [Mycobacteriales bacterium]
AAVSDAVHRTVQSGALSVTPPAEVTVERPRVRDHGDYASNVALKLAGPARRPPREVAELIATRLREHDGVAAVDVAGPGFLNIRLAEGTLGAVARAVVQAGSRYGHTDRLAGQRINLEYVSANPTGPVHLGAVRWAAVGDALARLLAASGAQVTREYYFNDAGAQIDRFGESLYAAARGEPTPENGYAGQYVADLAARITAARPGILDGPAADALEAFRHDGIVSMLDEIRSTLELFGVVFDVYVNERDLHARGRLDEAVDRLRRTGHVYTADGAVWLRTTDLGDDKDRVLLRGDGRPTYFCADVAYYLDKRDRGFDRVIIVLGADHHGYVGRMRAAVACLGDNPDQTLEIPLGQLVNLVRHGMPVRMSKRHGTVVTLEDVIEAVGVDAARYALARTSMDSTIDLDVDLWTRRSADNPVFYVQYAHARLASLRRSAVDLGIDPGEVTDADLGPLTHEREVDLLRTLGEFPRVVAGAAELRAPHRVARYLEELAGTYHRCYEACRVLPRGDEPVTGLTVARLWLCEATRIVLGNGLGLLGVTAPERL